MFQLLLSQPNQWNYFAHQLSTSEDNTMTFSAFGLMNVHVFLQTGNKAGMYNVGTLGQRVAYHPWS